MDITTHIKEQGLSRAGICERAGISRAFLSLIEKGHRRVGIAKVGALAEALGVEALDLRPDLRGILDDRNGGANPPRETETILHCEGSPETSA